MTTIDEALREMRLLRHAYSGRISGYHLRYRELPAASLGDLPGEWGQRLQALLRDRDQGQIVGDTPIYIVCSDGMPVAWLTAHAAVVTPEAPMSPMQARHQRQAAEALRDLHRSVLDQLADERDSREGRRVLTYTEQERMPGALRIAPGHDPTRTAWVRIGPDLKRARATVGDAAGCAPDQILIITALWYGHHGAHAHRLDLAVLCAMHTVAAAHRVPLCVVGDWIDHDAGLAGQVDPDTLPRGFAQAYLGCFDSREDYTEHRMREQGWSDLLDKTGMRPFFDTRQYAHHLFTRQVLDIHRPAHLSNVERGTDVFRRASTRGAS